MRAQWFLTVSLQGRTSETLAVTPRMSSSSSNLPLLFCVQTSGQPRFFRHRSRTRTSTQRWPEATTPASLPFAYVQTKTYLGKFWASVKTVVIGVAKSYCLNERLICAQIFEGRCCEATGLTGCVSHTRGSFTCFPFVFARLFCDRKKAWSRSCDWPPSFFGGSLYLAAALTSASAPEKVSGKDDCQKVVCCFVW